MLQKEMVDPYKREPHFILDGDGEQYVLTEEEWKELYWNEQVYPGQIFPSYEYPITKEMIEDDAYGYPWEITKIHRQRIDGAMLSNKRLRRKI